MAGYPDNWEVPSRNRFTSNQPGGIAEPEQYMVHDFEPSAPEANHMRGIADELRKTAQGYDMDYRISNQPGDQDD